MGFRAQGILGLGLVLSAAGFRWLKFGVSGVDPRNGKRVCRALTASSNGKPIELVILVHDVVVVFGMFESKHVSRTLGLREGAGPTKRLSLAFRVQGSGLEELRGVGNGALGSQGLGHLGIWVCWVSEFMP